MGILNDREESVLKTIIEEFVRTGEPVGSRYVSRSGPLQLSAASIRNVMSDLEEKGLIEQPHTSSGRVPSDVGYRYYIDKLVTFDGLKAEDVAKLSNQMNQPKSNVVEMFKNLSRRMGEMTGSVGFVVAPKVNTLHLKQIEFMRLSATSVLAIIVTKSGMVHNVILDVDPRMTDSDLRQASNYMNMHFANKSIVELKEHIFTEMKKEKTVADAIIGKVFSLGSEVFKKEEFGDDVFIEGASNVLTMPEFRDVDRVRELYKLFEEKKVICEILDNCMEKQGVQIFVGSEIGRDNINTLGVVSKSYSKGGRTLGTLGIIGPKRMQYPHVAGIVDFSSRLITGLLEGLTDEDEG